MVPEDEVAEHYAVQSQCYAFNSATKQWWVRDSEHPYSTPADRPYNWIRGYHLGGRSITWGRQTYRMSDFDFNANKQDGHGIDWPIRYADISPWYDRVERFAGISGANEGLEQLPDGQFLPPMELNCLEAAFKKTHRAGVSRRGASRPGAARISPSPRAEHIALGRGPCQLRASANAVADTARISPRCPPRCRPRRKPATSPIVTDAIVERLDYDHAKRRVSGVRMIDANTKQGRSYQARMVFVCASTIGTAQILLASQSEYFPNGLANRSDAVGRHLMDHVVGIGAAGTHPGFLDRYYYGRRPTGFYLPRYINVTEKRTWISLRGFGFQGYSGRSSWERAANETGVGARAQAAAAHARAAGRCSSIGFGEMLPRAENRVTLHATRKDRWGIPLRAHRLHARRKRTPSGRARQSRRRSDADRRGFRERARRSVRASHRVIHARDGHRAHGARPRDLGAQWPQPGARRTEPVHHRRLVHDFDGHGEPLADLYGAVRASRQLRRGPARLGRNLTQRVTRLVRGARRGPDEELAESGGHGGDARLDFGQRETHSGGPGRGFRHDRNPSAIQGACDLPYSPRSGPNAFITATCHTDVSGVERARWARAGRRAEIKSRAVRGLPRADRLLVSGGSFGHSFAPAGPYGFAGQSPSRERTTRMPARCKPLKHKEQDPRDPLCPAPDRRDEHHFLLAP